MNAIAHRVVIGYGSESGNARALAQQLAADPALQPFSPQVLTLNEISPGMLQDGNPLFIISSQFGDGWAKAGGCDTRNVILRRDLANAVLGDDNCKVQAGALSDPYTGQRIAFKRGANSSGAVQIDHVVALSNAWQTGAQQLSSEQRISLANDPLELLAVDGPANQQKGDGDAATWLPSNKPFRCQYIARQIAVKKKYSLWVTPPERTAMERILANCPEQRLPA